MSQDLVRLGNDDDGEISGFDLLPGVFVVIAVVITSITLGTEVVRRILVPWVTNFVNRW